MRALAIVALLGVLGAAVPALGGEPAATAPTEQADALFRAAAAAFDRQDYGAAAAGFDAAYQVAPHPVTRFNAAKAWDLAGDRARAANGWAEVADAAELDPPSRATARQRLVELDRALGRLRIAGPGSARARVSGFASGALPWEVRLEPGRHTVEIEQAGQRHERSVEIVAGEQVSLETSAMTPAPPEPVPDAERPGPVAAESGAPPTLWVGVGSFVLAGAGIAVGAGLGAAALSSRDDYEASSRFDLDARDRAARERDASTGVFIAAGVCAAVGLVLVVVSQLDSAPGVTSAMVFP
jgi:hypothetical protein